MRNFLRAKKPQGLLRLGFGLRFRWMLGLRQGENIGVIKPDLCRDASFPPVLDTLHAVAQAHRQFRDAVVIDESFVSGHFSYQRNGLDGHIKHHV
jgi:hypothetical protein